MAMASAYYSDSALGSLHGIDDAGMFYAIPLQTPGDPSTHNYSGDAALEAALLTPKPYSEFQVLLAELQKPPPPPAPMTPTEKLAKAGLTVEELKALLAG